VIIVRRCIRTVHDKDEEFTQTVPSLVIIRYANSRKYLVLMKAINLSVRYCWIARVVQTIPPINLVEYLIRHPREIYSCHLIFAFVFTLSSIQIARTVCAPSRDVIIQCIVNRILATRIEFEHSLALSLSNYSHYYVIITRKRCRFSAISRQSRSRFSGNPSKTSRLSSEQLAVNN
jgi:hypothetical protein